MDGLAPLAEFFSDCFAWLRSGDGELILAWIIALTLVWSGAAKLKSPRLASLAFADFGISSSPRVWYGFALAGAEILIGIGIGFGVALRLLLPITALLFAVFALLIGRSLLAKDSFACYCFGSQDEALSARSFFRATALFAIAVLCATAPIQNPTSAEWFMAGLSGVAILASLTLVGRFSRLLRWNAEIVVLYRERADCS